MTAAVRTEGLTKVFVSDWKRQRTTAVDRLDLEVAEGEVYGFLGPNGAGKTTTLKLLLGLLRPTSGRATILGADAAGLAHRAQLGYLPESPYFYDYLTGREFLDFCGRLCAVAGPARRERIARLLALVGMEQAADVSLRRYSKGMLQRIGLAQALVNDPRLLILDEPQSGLDPAGRKQVRDLILRLKAEGRTVLFSSHILGDAEMICDRVGVMNRGRLVAAGRLDELLRARVHAVEFQADGLGAAAREAFRARATQFLESGERSQFTLPGGEEQVPAVLAEIGAGGGRVVAVSPLKETLEEFFLREVQGP
ncbi:MAG TPA: ABC transporter ATP-binding protein [bacterium]